MFFLYARAHTYRQTSRSKLLTCDHDCAICGASASAETASVRARCRREFVSACVRAPRESEEGKGGREGGERRREKEREREREERERERKREKERERKKERERGERVRVS